MVQSDLKDTLMQSERQKLTNTYFKLVYSVIYFHCVTPYRQNCSSSSSEKNYQSICVC